MVGMDPYVYGISIKFVGKTTKHARIRARVRNTVMLPLGTTEFLTKLAEAPKTLG